MASTKITVNSNGSLKVEGDFEIVDKNGNVYDLAEEQRFLFAVAAYRKTNLFAMHHIKGILNMKQLLLLCLLKKFD